MQNNENCLETAMFLASESYSGSAYEANLLDGMCEEFDIVIRGNDMRNTPALAA